MRTRLRILGAALVTSVAVAAVPILTSSDAEAVVRFSGGNLVVYRVGSGAALTNAAAPVFLDEYAATPSANPIQSIPLPTAAVDGNRRLTAAGQSRSEGLISNSKDGHFVTLTGYDAAPGTLGTNGTSLTNSDPASIPRVVGILDANGTVDTSTTFAAATTPKIIRSAVSTDGDRIYAAGGNGGVLTTTLGSPTVSTVGGDASSNLNQLTIQNGQLYTSGIVANRLAKVGSGLPTAGAGFTAAPGLPATLLTYGYALLDLTNADWAGTGADTLYVANATNRAGTVEKYRWDGASWTRAAAVIDAPGVTGLVAHQNGATVDLAVTTPSKLLLVTDPSGTSTTFGAAAPTTLATAPVNTEFRGVALAPTGAGTEGPSAFVRSPATGSTVNIAAAGVTASVYAKSPTGGAVNSVTLGIGGTTVNATKGAGDLWTGTVPSTGLTTGATTLVVKVTGTGGTTTVNRSITLGGNPPVVTPPSVGGGGTTTPPAPKDALVAGKHAPSDPLVVLKGKWKSYKTSSSPTKKGLASAKKKSTLTTKVYGSQLVITFDKSNKSGQVSVTVDGKQTVIDLFNTKPKAFAKVFKFSGALTSHTVVITVLGTKKTKSTGLVVSVASLEVK
jgi:hypothetical protein